MGLYGKWSTCRSCYAALLLGGSCGLLSHSGCTQKRQNEQCLTPQWRGKKSMLKQLWGRRKARVSLVYQRKTWCRMESAVFRRHLQDKKSSVLCKAAGSGSSQLQSLPSVHLLEQIPKKCVQQLCATARLMPWMKLEAERFSPAPGTGHDRSYNSLIWKGNRKSQLVMALPIQVPFSPLFSLKIIQQSLFSAFIFSRLLIFGYFPH